MRKPLALVVVFVLAVGSTTAQTRTRSADKPSSLEERKSLLLMDLLRQPQEGMTPPQRNIFAPGVRTGRRTDFVSPGSQPWEPDDQPAEMPGLTPWGTAGPPVIAISLRYIGFIQSSGRMIALVVFEGQAVAVAEGEVLGERTRIGKITREQVEIVLPDSPTRAFSLEGE